MKSFLFLLYLALPATVLAESRVKPDFVCIEESGFTYNFYFSSFTEIHIFDEKGKAVDQIDSIQMHYRSIETSPTVDQYSFVDEDGHQVAQIEFKQGAKKGSGEMTDNDQAMKCSR
ncbi:MAG: hypothetical protein SGJ18_16280 [Pseudomonadota bacterium]|nr:hypothetical protein [Pseudomonadota bacterium]